MQSVVEETAQKLQTLFLKHGLPTGEKVNLRRLRVLNVRNASNAKELLTCIGKSKGLRFLDISGTQIERLPKFITQLYKLQTFRFMNCKSLKIPLEGLGNLINLRHIYFNDEERMPANLGRLTKLQTLQLFFVGTKEGYKVEELGSLSRLKGKIEICNLELVKDRSEAEKAKVHEKAIDELKLSWGEEGNHNEDVFEGLKPSCELQILSIKGYGGSNLPSWVLEMANLVELNIESCGNLKSIPPLKGLSCLEKLHVDQCSELTSIGDWATSLQSLTLSECPELRDVSVSGLASLRRLDIYRWDKARDIGESLSTSTYLEELIIIECSNLSFIPSLDGLTCLKTILIFHCYAIKCLPSGLSSCTALEKLEIVACSNLESIPEDLKELRSLVHLDITRCPKLRSIPEESLAYLGDLKTLDMGGFSNELDEFPGLNSISHLHASLEMLGLYGWEKLTRLPRQILLFSALKVLRISHFNRVEALPEWFGTLSSLRKLTFESCHNLMSFPKELKGLSSLVELNICDCPKLSNLEMLGCLKLKKLFFGKVPELEEYPDLSAINASLEELFLLGWDKLNQLPHQIQHLNALKKLTIRDFNGIETLPEWLGSLSSLQTLNIWHCENLKQLPSTEAIQRLSKLNSLEIIGCPKLEEKCTKFSNSEWLNICHIPNIQLGRDFIKSEY